MPHNELRMTHDSAAYWRHLFFDGRPPNALVFGTALLPDVGMSASSR